MYRIFLGILWLCTKIITSSQANATDFFGILTGDDNLTVFADGRLIGYNGGSWSAARWFTFSSETKVIAVSVYNLPGHVGGFLGVFSNGVTTDSSWKCKEILITPDDGWEQTNFNDSTWPRAFIRHDNSGPSGFIPVAGIPHNVHWISAANHNAVRFICRHHFTEEEKLSNSTLIAIRASSPSQTVKLYLDGVFTAKADLSLTVVKDQHELQAIHVEDPSAGADVFFVSSSSNGIRTEGTSWRCSNQYHEGWFLPNFTDGSWPRPYAVASNTYFIAPDAQWIAYLLAQSNKIFCRRNIVELDLHIVSSYDTPSSATSLVPQETICPTSSITSTTVVRPSSAMKPIATTRTIVSTVVPQSVTSSSRTFSAKVSGISETNRFSTLVIVVIAVSGSVTVAAIGLIVSCSIWRRRNSGRGNNEHKLQKKDETRDKWEVKSNEVTIYEELGHGAFGKVCKGIMTDPLCMKTGQSVYKTSKKIANSAITVAVKMLQDNASPDQMNDFIEEITLMKTVGSHKNILSLIGCCTKSTPNFLIVEFASKGDLLSYLRERRKKVKDTNMDYVSVRENASNAPGSLNKDGAGIHCRRDVSGIGQVNVAFSKTDSSIDLTFTGVQSLNDEEQDKGDDEDDSITPQDMMSFSWQIAQGMQYLSAKGIVHRDLAARNVLVCDNKLVKVADFGLARSTLGENVYHMTGQHNKLPVKWMSPEAINDGVFTTKSDVWSYGVLLWEIATLGGFPYPGIKNRELMRLLRRGYRMDKPDTCSEEFYQMMRRCWADNPDMRPTFTDLFQELEDWIQREIPYLDMDQLNEDQPYYEASAVSPSSGSSCDEHAPGESLDSNTAADSFGLQ